MTDSINDNEHMIEMNIATTSTGSDSQDPHMRRSITLNQQNRESVLLTSETLEMAKAAIMKMN